MSESQILFPRLLVFWHAYTGPPRGEHFDCFFEILDRNRRSGEGVIVFGDFNAHLEQSCTDADELNALVLGAQLQLLQTGASFHEGQNHSWLDVVIVDEQAKIKSLTKSNVPFIDYHDFFLLHYEFSVQPVHTPPQLVRSFRNFDIESFKADVSLVVAFHTENIHNYQPGPLLSYFNSDLIALLDKHAPLVTHPRPKFKPWLNDHIKSLIAKRNRFYKIFKITNKSQHRDTYKLLSKQVMALDRAAEKDYHAAQFSAANKTSTIYRLLTNIGYSNKRSSAKTAVVFFAPDDIIQYIADTYSIHPPCTPAQLKQILAQHPINPNIVPFNFHEITYQETLKAFNKALLKSKGNSPDNIKLKHLASVIPSISTFFTLYYNKLLTTASYPHQWKVSLIIPLLKTPIPSGLGDIRPITNLYHQAKPLDSIIASQVSSYFETNNCFSQFQSGCRPGFSTQTALTKLVNDARAAIDRNEVTLLLLYDFRKAFNSVGHYLLLLILRQCGFDDDAIRFIYTYLIDRFMVMLGSKMCPYTCGVGQGSGPGGNFFLMFVNTVFYCFLFMLVILFVDDAQGFLHSTVDNINLAIRRANQDSAALVHWTQGSGIALNPCKVKAIIIGSRANLLKLRNMTLQPLVVDGVVIPLSESVTSLGLTLSNDLKWQKHLSGVVTSTNRVLYALNHKARSLPIRVKKLLAAQLLFPRFDYACVCFLDLSVELQGKLDRQLNKAVRFVFNLFRRSSTLEFRQKLNWLTLYQRRQYYLLTLTYKVLKTKRPSYLYQLIEPYIINYSHTQVLQTRNRPVFAIPIKTSRSYDASFTIASMKAWNCLSDNLRNAESIDQFKTLLKRSYLNSP